MKKTEYDFTKIPFDRLVRVGQLSMIYNDLFTVSWILGRFCNYKCSYCWEHGRSDKKDHRSLKTCILAIRNIKQQARERGFNSFHFSLSGGEPTFHPHYLDIVEELADDAYWCNFHSIHMTTNLSRGMEWLKKYAMIVSRFHRASVTASYHAEYADVDEFIKKLVMLQEHDIHVTVNMVMVPEHFERDHVNAIYINNHGINVTLKPQSDPHANFVVSGYTDEQMKILHNGFKQFDYTKVKQKGIRQRRPIWNMSAINDPLVIDPMKEKAPAGMQVEFVDDEGKYWYMDQAERFNAFNFNKFKDWECSSGYRSIIIREPCGSIKRSYSCIDEPIGHIEDNFKLFDKPKECISPSCVSSADSKIPKRKPGTKLPLFPGDKTYESPSNLSSKS